MMKNYLALFLFFILLSCQSPTTPYQDKENSKQNPLLIHQQDTNVITFPSHHNTSFQVDTIKKKEVQNKYSIAYYSEQVSSSVDTTQQALHQARLLIYDYYQQYLSELTPPSANAEQEQIGMQPFFSVYLVSIYQRAYLVSFLYELEYAHPGVAHAMHEYVSFNYDLLQQKRLLFQDYFQIITEEDSFQCLYLINEAIELGDIGAQHIYEIDFHPQERGISFYFDAYELGSYAMGMPKGQVSWRAIWPYIRKRYQVK